MLINNMVWLVRFPNPLVKVASGSGNLTRCGNQHQALYGALELGWIQINCCPTIYIVLAPTGRYIHQLLHLLYYLYFKNARRGEHLF